MALDGWIPQPAIDQINNFLYTIKLPMIMEHLDHCLFVNTEWCCV